MIPYILHVALLISVCLLFYKALLQKETFYRLNRVVLIFCLALSFALPLIPVPHQWALRDSQNTVGETIPKPVIDWPLITVRQSEAKKPVITANSIVTVKAPPVEKATPAPAIAPAQPAAKAYSFLERSVKWLVYLYWIGVAAFGLNLLLQLIVLLYQVYTRPSIRDGKFRIIELSGDKAPCSFGNNIFINPEKYDWETYSQILLHEKIHIQQGHTLDILIAELVLVLQWFNPFAWLYRTELENNLEFLTDDSVLGHEEIERSSYQMSLLKVSAPHLSLGITTNYNQSLLKKRILMMNSKKSNIHIMWKYFFLLPLLGVLACALNDPAAYSEAIKTNVKNRLNADWSINAGTEGSWFATIKTDKIRLEFRSDEEDDHNWSSNSDFKMTEFSALPRDKKGDFTLTRAAGNILFNGKFDGNQGYGHYKFTANKEYRKFLAQHGITDLEDNDDFAFFVMNINKEYVAMLERNGYTKISKNDVMSMAALKVDEPYIRFWKENGYGHITPDQLVSAKALGITETYIAEIRKSGYNHLTFDQLVSFKATGITGKYLTGLHGNIIPKTGKGKSVSIPNVSADDVLSVKAMNIDAAYIDAPRKEGYTNISMNDLTSMKALGITPEYVEGFKNAGYKNISPDNLESLKSLSITPGDIKKFNAVGYKNLQINDLSSMKALGVTPEYIAAFIAIGYKHISIDDLMSLKSLGITPEFSKSFQSVGFNNLSVNDMSNIKSMGITRDYIESFRAIGYKDISINTASSLKAIGITADFIEGFKKIGYQNISLDEASSLKAVGVTPAYVSQMRAKGFKLDDLDKYIELKTAFN